MRLQGLGGIGRDGLQKTALVPPLGHPNIDLVARTSDQPRLDGLLRHDGHKYLEGDVRVFVPVELLRDSGHEFGRRLIGHLLHHEGVLATHTAPAHVEDLEGRLEFVLHKTDHVGAGGRREHECRALHGLAQGAEVVAEASRGLVVLHRGRGAHLSFEVSHEPLGARAEEGHELLREFAVVLLRDPPDTRRAALTDIAQQARPPHLCRPPEHTVAARAYREDP